MKSLRLWLALIRAPRLGPATITSLVRRYETPENVLKFAPRDLDGNARFKPETLAALAQPDWKGIERDLTWANAPNQHIVMFDDERYPSLLKNIASAPLALFVRGSVDALHSPQVAMVGSRNPSPGGRQAALDLACELAARGLTITSGLALGIDAASHQGALNAGGCTIAVGATGPDQVYPRRHQALAEAIVAGGGALVTEFPTGVPPAREHFPRRNRVVSGMAYGTVVVEAALKSGSLITAHYAVEQGREVFAVPGSIYNVNAAGCHALIKQGAKLVERADDIVEELGFCTETAWNSGGQAAQKSLKDGGLCQEQDRVLNVIGYEPTSVDTVIERTGMTAEQVTSIMMELEIEGRVASMSSGMYVRQAGSSAP